MNLAAVDLNLLIALRALLRERSVTRAARGLRLSQPAMSNTLTRLRRLLGDPLLVRSGGQMSLTPRADALRAPLEEIIERISGLLTAGTPFAPEEAREVFRVAATDYVEMVLLPRMAAAVQRAAPRCALDVRPIAGESSPVPALGAGELDLALGVFFDLPPGFYREELLRERLVCVLRRGHPALHEEFTVERFAALPHLLVAPRRNEPGVIDRALASRGLTRHIALYVPHFLVAPQIVAESDLVVTLPERAAQHFATFLPLEICEPPLPALRFPVSMVWHERTHQSPAHRWLRSQVPREVRREDQADAASPRPPRV